METKKIPIIGDKVEITDPHSLVYQEKGVILGKSQHPFYEVTIFKYKPSKNSIGLPVGEKLWLHTDQFKIYGVINSDEYNLLLRAGHWET